MLSKRLKHQVPSAGDADVKFYSMFRAIAMAA